MTPDAGPVGAPGVTVVTRTAARRLIAALVAADLGVPARRVDVRITDDRARWRVEVTAATRNGTARTVIAAADAVRDRITREVPELAGAALGRVSVRITDIEDERSRAA
ncbi:hypothetical protein [Pseudolysinimonas sp.]|uniref:hypothetical protein n=1 Tax=Pseudolysinimonas sp. TaxID=2680009 RepID=UPI003F8159DD